MNSRENNNSSSSSTKSNDDIVEITLDLNDDSMATQTMKTTRVVNPEDQELALLGRGLGSATLVKRDFFSGNSRILHVAQELKGLASSSKSPQKGKFDRKNSGATRALRGLNFVSKIDVDVGWMVVEHRFDELTKDTNGLLCRAQFGECIGMIKIPEDETSKNKKMFEDNKFHDKKKCENKKCKDKETKEKAPKHKSQDFAVQVFDALSRRRNIFGSFVDKAELRELWDRISDQSFDSRLMIFFDMVDKDADGKVNADEVREIIASSASATKLSNIKDKAGEYAALLMEELDPNNLGYIMIHDLETVLLKANTYTARVGDSKVLSEMLSERLKPMSDSSPLRKWYEKFKYFLLDNWQRVWMMSLWIGAMVYLFVYKYIQYKNNAAFDVMGHCVCMAKGAAETLKLNMALILLLVCRNTITWLRNKTRLGVSIPFDDNINLHQIIAIAILIGVGIHGISHLACDFPRLLHATPEEYEPMKKYFGDYPSSYWLVDRVTGIIMVVLMAIAFTLSSPWFRGDKVKLPKPFNIVIGFNAFWYSHHLFVIVYTLLIVHGIKLNLTKEWYRKTTWMYLAVPVVLYASERLVRAIRSRIKQVDILKVAIHPGDPNVISLHMSKPEGFGNKSGQYMLVNCPVVSPFEWHPFSITSAPGGGYLSAHITTDGDWTKHLKIAFEKVCQHPPDGVSRILRAEFLQGLKNPNVPRVLIDGPYGAPTQAYKNYDIVLLVGIGMRATPMISIVKDIVNNMTEEEDDIHPLPPAIVLPVFRQKIGKYFRTRKAYFYFVTGQQGTFDWFKEVMDEVAEMDHKGVIEMNNYCTSVYEEGDARSALITMIQSLNQEKNGVDTVCGTKDRSHFAKPNWNDVYKHITINHLYSKIGVFYCGPPEATKKLKQLASAYSQANSTKFEFHKEDL